MSRSQLASAHPQDPPTVVVQTGGGNLSGGTIYFSLQARTRAGWTVPTSLVATTYAAGDAISISIPVSARADGDDIRRWDVSASLTNDATTLQVIGSVDGYALDEETLSALPLVISFTENDHLGLGVIVADEASLPTGANILNGMIRFVTDKSKFYRYDPRSTRVVDGDEVLTAATGRWVRAFSFSTYIASTLDPAGGLDRDIRSINDGDIIFPSYPADGSAGISTTFMWYHDEGTSAALAQGTRFTFSVVAGDQNKARLFTNKLKLTFLGFVDLATGVLDKTGDGGVGLMDGVDEEINFVSGKTGLILQKNLPVGSGYLVRVRPQFSLGDLRDEIGVNTPLRMFLYPFSQAGSYSEAGAFLGDIIYAEDDRLKVVPASGLSVNMLQGGAMVDSLSFLGNPVTAISGLALNSSDQIVAINGNGAAFLRSAVNQVGATEAIRAFVSTEQGQGQLTAESNSAVVTTATGSITINVPYPSDANGVGDIRSSYPDTQIAGLAGKSTFNPPTIYLFLTRASDGFTYQYTQSVVPGASQSFTISAFSAGTFLTAGTFQAALPAPATADQGLFVPGTPTVVASDTGGFLSADTYTVYAAFYHDGNQVSRIDNGATGTIAVLETTIAEVVEALNSVSNVGAPFDVFTGDVSAYIPTTINKFYLKVDVVPMLLYYSTALTAGGLTLVGGGSTASSVSWLGMTEAQWLGLTEAEWLALVES